MMARVPIHFGGGERREIQIIMAGTMLTPAHAAVIGLIGTLIVVGIGVQLGPFRAVHGTTAQRQTSGR